MCKIDARLLQQIGHEVGSSGRVFDHHPMEILHMEECVGQPGQLSLLHWPGVGGRDHKNGRQCVQPGRGPGIDIASDYFGSGPNHWLPSTG